jgi:nucleoid-associated protein YgaU
MERMQQEVNEFMAYVKKELARGLDDWEQRLSTAMVKSSPTDLVRAGSTGATGATGAPGATGASGASGVRRAESAEGADEDEIDVASAVSKRSS